MSRKNTERHITFSVSIEKELANVKTVRYEIKFIETLRFIDSSLPSLADNLAKELHNSRCEDCESYLEYMKVKDKLLIFKFLKCNKTIKFFSKNNLLKRFANVYKFGYGDINKF